MADPIYMRGSDGAIEGLIPGGTPVGPLYWDGVNIVITPTSTVQGGGGGPHAASHQLGGGDVLSVAGLSGLLATAQTPAAHTQAWSTITTPPTTLAGYGITDAAALVHTHPASDIASGTIATARLGGGTASGSTFLRGDQQWAAPGGGSATPLRTYPLIAEFPFGGAPTTMTPTVHTATVARVQPFTLSGAMTVNQIRIRTNAVLANCLRLGIFDSTGAQVWASGVLSTVATNWVTVAVSALALPAGDYYFATTNNNVASTTAAYTVTPAIGAVGVARWGTVPATAGAMPASINPAAITETTGGWMSYVTLSEWTT